MNLTLFIYLVSYMSNAKNVLVKQLLWILYGAGSEEFLSCQIDQTIVTNKI